MEGVLFIYTFCPSFCRWYWLHLVMGYSEVLHEVSVICQNIKYKDKNSIFFFPGSLGDANKGGPL